MKVDKVILTEFNILIRDAKYKCCLLSFFHIDHISSEINVVAHSLAKYHLCIMDFQAWMEQCPSSCWTLFCWKHKSILSF